MCGQYLFYDERNGQIRDILKRARAAYPADVYESLAKGRVMPSNRVIAAYYNPRSDSVVTNIMRWGYAKFDGKGLVINARSETVNTSRFFAGSRHCILPACGYYEFSADHARYLFTTEEETIYMAGICHREGDEVRFVILTQPSLSPIHNREPVLVDYENAKRWCLHQDTAFASLQRFAREA